MAEKRRRQNDKLDLLKCAAIYSVIFIHVPLPGRVGEAVNCLARFAVPLFFLISGYFSWEAGWRRLMGRALRTGRLLLGTLAALLLLGCALAAKRGEAVSAYLRYQLDPGLWRGLPLYQVVPLPYAWPLWFLVSLFFLYLLWGCVAWAVGRGGRKMPYNALAAAAVLLLALHLALGEGRSLMGLEPVNPFYLRNAWLDGLPFFALGAWMAEHRSWLDRARPAALWIGAALSGLLALGERGAAGVLDLHLGAGLMAVLLLAAALGRPEVSSPVLRRTACFCGRELTFYIFAFHVPLYGILWEWQDQVTAFAWALGRPWLLPFLVAALTTLLALALYTLSKLGKNVLTLSHKE